jgi:hypothetical protein
MVLPAPALAVAAELRVGVAAETFELPRWVPLAGYSRRRGKPSTGRHDPVGARALVIGDEDTLAALVSCDLLVIDERLFEAVRERIAAAGLSSELILLVAATHTHSGPGAYGATFLEKLSMGHYDPQVFTALADAIARTVVRAHANLAPARLAYAATDTEGLIRNRVDPDGLVESELAVVGFFRPGASPPFAVLVNFAAHPTALGAWNRQLSADYPGVLTRELERRLPGAIALFVAGAVADQAPVTSGDDFERADGIGRALAEQAAALIGRMQPELVTTVRARQERFPLPPAEVRLGELGLGRVVLPQWIGARLVDDDATLSALTVGPVAFFGVPCDLEAALGRRLKRAALAHDRKPVIVGFASDYIGYCVSAELYDAKHYEASLAFNGPQAGERLIERLVHVFTEMAAVGSAWTG